MKSIINKIFPREQKFLNLIKLLYIFIFIISTPEMFERFGSADLTNTFGKTIALLLFIIMFFVSIVVIIIQYLSKNEKRFVTTSILIVQIFLYFLSTKLNNYASELINPLYILPLLISFIFINRKSQNFNRNLVIFLFMPFFVVTFDKVISLNFQMNCRYNTPNAEYNPIYLDKKFFHKENINGVSRLIPNIKEFYHMSKDDTAELLEKKNNIVLFNKCFSGKYDLADKLIEKGNIVLCVEEGTDDTTRQKNSKNFINNTVTSNIKIKILKKDKSFTQIATFYYTKHIKNYLRLYFLGSNSNYCKYNNIFTSNNYFKYTYNYWEKFRKNELAYDNYIKFIK